jgi:zinc protease
MKKMTGLGMLRKVQKGWGCGGSMNKKRSALFVPSLVVVGWLVALPTFAALQIESWQTPKGAKVLYAYAPELPMVDVRVVFDAGSARDTDKKGVAYLTNQLIGQGDAQRDEERFSEESEGLGLQFSTQALKDMAVINIRSLTRADVLEPALALSASAISKPLFSEAVLKREKAQLLTRLQAKQQSASALARDAFWQQLYDQHPYAYASEGTLDSVKTITSADLKQFYRRYYTATNAVVAIVGQVDKAKAQAMAIQLVDSLPQGQRVQAVAAVTAPIAGMKQIDYPASQTQILMGQLGVHRLDADYIPLYVANHILGGSGFASRLMEEVREKRGLVYGVSSALIPMRQQGPWMLSLQTATNNAPEALAVVKETLAGLLADIPESELQEHKDNIIGSFALETDSNKDIVGYLAMMGFYQLPLTWMEDFPKQVAALDRQQLLAVVRRHLQPEQWTGVLLGKPADTQAGAKALPVTPKMMHQ